MSWADDWTHVLARPIIGDVILWACAMPYEVGPHVVIGDFPVLLLLRLLFSDAAIFLDLPILLVMLIFV